MREDVLIACKAAFQERFWAKVCKLPGKDTCWIWTAYIAPSGYGRIGISYLTYNAHRVAWILEGNIIPEGLDVLHKCDNPICVRPSHLFIGTAQVNATDRELKGRGNQCKGENRPNHVLTEEQVRAILKAHNTGYPNEVIAHLYSLSTSNVWHIVNRLTWKHIVL